MHVAANSVTSFGTSPRAVLRPAGALGRVSAFGCARPGAPTARPGPGEYEESPQVGAARPATSSTRSSAAHGSDPPHGAVILEYSCPASRPPTASLRKLRDGLRPALTPTSCTRALRLRGTGPGCGRSAGSP